MPSYRLIILDSYLIRIRAKSMKDVSLPWALITLTHQLLSTFISSPQPQRDIKKEITAAPDQSRSGILKQRRRPQKVHLQTFARRTEIDSNQPILPKVLRLGERHMCQTINEHYHLVASQPSPWLFSRALRTSQGLWEFMHGIIRKTQKLSDPQMAGSIDAFIIPCWGAWVKHR